MNIKQQTSRPLNHRNTIELLAPAGSMDALTAAVQAGANAVYLAGPEFGARKFASNFSREELTEAVRYCHIRNVRVYVTVNTLVADSETAAFIDFVRFLYESDVDALILQDMGMAQLIRSICPDLDLHGSTQMTAHNLEDFLFLKAQGFSRVVAARELKLEELEEIKTATAMEVEVFGQGALCVCYSGQCLMSSMIGGRSGNRGNCAQSCRQLYEIETEQGEVLGKAYYLSPKDLSIFDSAKLKKGRPVTEVLSPSMDSLKIEGRMKRPEYVYAVVSAYRALLDGDSVAAAAALQETDRIFTRGTTAGFVGGEDRKNMMQRTFPGNSGTEIARVERYDSDRGILTLRIANEVTINDELQIRRPEGTIGCRVEWISQKQSRIQRAQPGSLIDIPFKYVATKGEIVYRTVEDDLLKSVKDRYRLEYCKSDLTAVISIELGKPARLSVSDDLGNQVEVQGEALVESALKVALTRDRVLQNLEKTGGTPYQFVQVETKIEDGVSMPVSEINNLRRKAFEMLDHARGLRYPGRRDEAREQAWAKATVHTVQSSEGAFIDGVKLSAAITRLDQLKPLLELGVRRIYLSDRSALKDAAKMADARGAELIYRPGRILHADEMKVLAGDMKLLKGMGIHEVLAGNYGTVKLALESGLDFSVDWSMNVFNGSTLDFYQTLGAKSVAFSNEMTLDQIGVAAAVKNADIQLETLGFGLLPVMTTAYCVVSGVLDCKACKASEAAGEKLYLKDKMDAKFRLSRDSHCRTRVFNSAFMLAADMAESMTAQGLDYVRLEYFDEPSEFVYKSANLYDLAVCGDRTASEKLKRLSETYYGMSATRGHLKRGVL